MFLRYGDTIFTSFMCPLLASEVALSSNIVLTHSKPERLCVFIIYLLFIYFLAMPHGLRDLDSLTKV